MTPAKAAAAVVAATTGETLTAAGYATTNTAPADGQENDNTYNQIVNAYPPSILCSPSTMKVPLDTVIQHCQHKATQKVTFSPEPPTFIPYPFLVTKHITTSIQFPECLVIDSGCNAHMQNQRSMFDYITPINNTTGHPLIVQQGDGSYLNIKGYRQVTEQINGRTIRTMAYYVPDLGCSLFSVRQHVRYQGCHFHAENNTCTRIPGLHHKPKNGSRNHGAHRTTIAINKPGLQLNRS